jgi:hypothetical protein
MATTGTGSGTFGPFAGSATAYTAPDHREIAALARLRRLLPPPPPNSGWGYARQRAEAKFLGIDQDDQSSSMERQLMLGARLVRVGPDAADWAAPEIEWYMVAQSAIGAEGPWLDVWGGAVNVARIAGEPDNQYAVRILAEIGNPHTTNQGMAAMIDAALGIAGTVVLEADEYYDVARYDEPGRQFDAGLQFESVGELPINGLWGCFVVIIPSTTPNPPWTAADVAKVVRRRHAAGTRLLRVHTIAGGYSPTQTSTNPPDNGGMTVAIESATTIPSAYEVATPSAGGAESTTVTGE